MKNQPDANDVKKAMALASTPEGKRLLAALQKTRGGELERARDLSASGNYQGAVRAISGLLKDPEIRSLLEGLGGGYGGA